MVISRQPSSPRALLLSLLFQFCFVAIIKEARALSNKIITVCHICADCWVKVRTQALHPEGSKEGPSSSNSGVKDYFPRAPSFTMSIFVMKVLSQVIVLFQRFFYHEFLGTRLEQFHDSARLPVLLLWMIQDFKVRSCQLQSECFCSLRLSSRHSSRFSSFLDIHRAVALTGQPNYRIARVSVFFGFSSLLLILVSLVRYIVVL